MATDIRSNETLKGAVSRVDASEKRLINCHQVDVNQLMPLKYKWAWSITSMAVPITGCPPRSR